MLPNCNPATSKMDCRITVEEFQSLSSCWAEGQNQLVWSSPFVLPAWMEVWWQEFGGGAGLYLRSVREGETILGIAPLKVTGDTVSFVGSTDVCDYQDFIVAPGREDDFFTAFLAGLGADGVRRLDLGHLRPESTALQHLAPLVERRGMEATRKQEDVSLEVDLPGDFESYLDMLFRKQRHEVRRKLRHLLTEEGVTYRCVTPGAEIETFMDTFLKLFARSPEHEKAAFMTPRMESYFRNLARAIAGIDLLRFGAMEVSGKTVAMTFGFDYNGIVYLYNSAYDPDYSALSVGVLSKVLGIKASIESGRKKWDFLKGGETYKYHIGGREVPLYRLQVTLG